MTDARSLRRSERGPFPDSGSVARLIDHTCLRPDAGSAEIDRLCSEARRYGFYSVCVAPKFVERARGRLQGSDVRVCTVVDFPLGFGSGKSRVYAAMDAVNRGAHELDVVAPAGAFAEGKWKLAYEDIAAIVMSTPQATHKVILETGYLPDSRKVRAAKTVVQAGAAFVKTCTGFGPGRATTGDVSLLRNAVGEELGVKASGGIRTLSCLMRLAKAGASRIGTSSALSIIEELSAR